MSKSVTVPIPQSMIDEASGGEVKKLTNKVERLEKKIKKLEENEEKVQEILRKHKEFKLFIQDYYDLHDYYEDF